MFQSRGWTNQRTNRTLSDHPYFPSLSLISRLADTTEFPPPRSLNHLFSTTDFPHPTNVTINGSGHCNHHNPKYLANFARDQYRKSGSSSCPRLPPSIIFFSSVQIFRVLSLYFHPDEFRTGGAIILSRFIFFAIVSESTKLSAINPRQHAFYFRDL